MRDLAVRRYPRLRGLPRIASLARDHLWQHLETRKARGLLVLRLLSPSLADADGRAPRADVARVSALALIVKRRGRRLWRSQRGGCAVRRRSYSGRR